MVDDTVSVTVDGIVYKIKEITLGERQFLLQKEDLIARTARMIFLAVVEPKFASEDAVMGLKGSLADKLYLEVMRLNSIDPKYLLELRKLSGQV